jgi:uncharacterized protein involved in exopolysaccharide biosynthesis/Mrp family chromosome partitioning ATPase
MIDSHANHMPDAGTGGGSVFRTMRGKLLYLAAFVVLVGALTYFVLTQLSPSYLARAFILVEASEGEATGSFDTEAVSEQIRDLRSPGLARTVSRELDFIGRPEFNTALRVTSFVSDFLILVGLNKDPSWTSAEELVVERFGQGLSVHIVENSRLVAIEFVSQDPQLAADAANSLAKKYISSRQTAQRETTEDSVSWLKSEIARMTDQVSEAEARVEAFRVANDGATIGEQMPAGLERQGEAVGNTEILQGSVQLRTTIAPVIEPEENLLSLKHEAARQRDLLASYLDRYHEVLARRSDGTLLAEARIISLASAPSQPAFPQTGKMTIAACLAALILGLAFMGIQNIAGRRRMRRAALVSGPETEVGKTRWRDDNAVRRMMPSDPTFAPGQSNRIDESVATIADRIIAGGYKRIMVTMPEGADWNGRPLAAVALGRAMAQAEQRPVLIDLCPDGANSASMGEADEFPGFSDLFAGEASFAQVIFRDRKSRVHFIPGGAQPLSPQKLTDERVVMLVSALDHTYDHVILDIGEEAIEAMAKGCEAAVLVSEFAEPDPRTLATAGRLAACSDAKVFVLALDPLVAQEAA